MKLTFKSEINFYVLNFKIHKISLILTIIILMLNKYFYYFSCFNVLITSLVVFNSA